MEGGEALLWAPSLPTLLPCFLPLFFCLLVSYLISRPRPRLSPCGQLCHRWSITRRRRFIIGQTSQARQSRQISCKCQGLSRVLRLVVTGTAGLMPATCPQDPKKTGVGKSVHLCVCVRARVLRACVCVCNFLSYIIQHLLLKFTSLVSFPCTLALAVAMQCIAVN